MSHNFKKPAVFLPFARLFTHIDKDAYDRIDFRSSESYGDEETLALASPSTWSAEAVALMAEAAFKFVPSSLKAIEENTVPSWLWLHQSQGKNNEIESDLRDIFNRAVGSAAAKAWKLGFFAHERQARTFYDEARFALMQRHIAIDPALMASWGLSWAYGVEELSPALRKKNERGSKEISNAAIDALISKTRDSSLSTSWKKLFSVPSKETSALNLRLSDIASDWHSRDANPASASIDVLALRHNDGGINIHALRQNVRLLTILLDLHDKKDVTIGIANLAPLLLAFGLTYDSDAARAMAASLMALITAECYATSAELAALRGMSDDYITDHDKVMRSLRNHRRAVYGDGNDYEKLSVLPSPLPLKNCPDLALVAEAQRRWDDVLHHVRAFGLRSVQVSDLTPSPRLSLLMTSASQGMEAMESLRSLEAGENGTYQTVLYPVVSEALVRLGYSQDIVKRATLYVVGTGSLKHAPYLSSSRLRARGLNDVAIEKIEAYLPCVNNVRLAVTPWIIGTSFCQQQLKISQRLWRAPNFDLLSYLGFSDTEIDEANLYCYGFGTLRHAKFLRLHDRPLFAYGSEISAEARLRMAAAIQSFISGDTGLKVRLPTSASLKSGQDLTLCAWRAGIKSFSVVFDPIIDDKPPSKSKARRIKAASHPHAKVMRPSQRRSVRKAQPFAPSKKAPGIRRQARENTK